MSEKVIKAVPIDWHLPTPKFKLGDVCWHTGINKRIEIISNPLCAVGRFSYNYKYNDGAGNTVKSSTPETLLTLYSEYDEYNPDRKIKINLVPATPIKRMIELIAPSLPKGDEIRMRAATYSRAVIKERDRKGAFVSQADFLNRLNLSAEFAHWGAISSHFDFELPSRILPKEEVMKPNFESDRSSGVVTDVED
jgi:hypothetical protein